MKLKPLDREHENIIANMINRPMAIVILHTCIGTAAANDMAGVIQNLSKVIIEN